MKKVTLIAGVITLAICSSALAGLNPLVFEIPKFTEPPVLDGNREADEWMGTLELECSIEQILRDGAELGWAQRRAAAKRDQRQPVAWSRKGRILPLPGPVTMPPARSGTAGTTKLSTTSPKNPGQHQGRRQRSGPGTHLVVDSGQHVAVRRSYLLS